MDYYRIPTGFGMALSMNPPALNVYSAMTEDQRNVILSKVYNARSSEEMHRIVNGLATNSIDL